MTSETKYYAIYDRRSDQLVASISLDGVVLGEGNPEVEEILKALMQEEIIIREHQIDFDPQTADEDFDPYPEEKMCYFNVITLQPGDPSYLKAFLTRLPYISHYEVRISEE
jgi:radical SAM superfamily enzyme YgiQ (UPF0313 family)